MLNIVELRQPVNYFGVLHFIYGVLLAHLRSKSDCQPVASQTGRHVAKIRLRCFHKNRHRKIEIEMKKLILPPDDNFEASVNIRLTHDQKDELIRIARLMGVSVSKLARHMLVHALDQIKEEHSEYRNIDS